MKKLFFFLLLISLSFSHILACTNLLVTKGASKNKSVMITYTCDGEFHPHFSYIPAADYKSGDSLEIRDWFGKLRGKIHQVPHTYQVVQLMNEHQVVIGETTFDGRLELVDPNGLLEYWDLMRFALQRAKTAREAIKVITSLVDQYGYASTGESFSIGDKNEAWVLEMIGKGPGKKGANWVAVKIPDGYVSCHANKARIGTFPLNDPENCIYSKDLIDFAVQQKLYDPKSGKPFRFNETFCPATPKNQRYSDGRVWSLLRRVAPSLKLSPAYFRGEDNAEEYPLYVKPDEKLNLQDVFNLMRDHFEGTEFDMTQGIDAGPFNSPNRWRPMEWSSGGKKYNWERPISTQQTGFSFVSESRAELPDAIGGVLWYGVDDTYFTCYVPFYCSINSAPKAYTTGQISKFSWDSAWWVFNFVANYSNLKYSYMKSDIQAVQKDIESTFIALQPAIEQTALALEKTNKDLLVRFLSDYSLGKADYTVARWKELGEYLIQKYNDGYIINKEFETKEVGYPSEWLERVIKEKPKQFVVPENKNKKPESRLID